MTRHPPIASADSADVRRPAAADRLLDILFIPVVGSVIAAKCFVGPELDIWFLTITLIYSIKFLLWGGPAGRPNWLDAAVAFVLVSETVGFLSSDYKVNSFHAYGEAIFLFLFYCLVRLHLGHEYQRVGIFLLVTVLGLYLSAGSLALFSRHYAAVTSLGFNDVTDLRQYFDHLRPADSPPGEWITIYLTFLPFPLWLSLRYADRSPVGGWLGLCPAVTILLAVAVTFSRGVYVAAAAFFVSGSLLLWLYDSAPLKRLARLNLCWLLTAVVIVVTPLWTPVLTTASLLKTTSQVRSLEGRAGLWKESWECFKDNPLVGVGANNFPLQYAAYKGEDSAFVGRTLNLFLQLLVERGLLGLSAYCLLFVSFFKVARDRARRAAGNPFQKTTAALFMACCIALLVRDLSHSSMLANQGAGTLLWFMFAVTGAGAQSNLLWPRRSMEE